MQESGKTIDKTVIQF